MIDYKKAIEIATPLVSEGRKVSSVFDCGKQFAVNFNFIGNGPVPPGDPGTILVDKETGRSEYLTIPPIENLKLLDAASIIWTAD